MPSNDQEPQGGMKEVPRVEEVLKGPALVRGRGSPLLVIPGVDAPPGPPRERTFFTLSAYITNGRQSAKLEVGPPRFIDSDSDKDLIAPTSETNRDLPAISVHRNVIVEHRGMSVQEVSDLPMTRIKIPIGRDEAFTLNSNPVAIDVGGRKIVIQRGREGETRFVSENGKEEFASFPYTNTFHRLTAGRGFAIDVPRGEPDRQEAEFIFFGGVVWIKNTSRKNEIRVGYLHPKQVARELEAERARREEYRRQDEEIRRREKSLLDPLHKKIREASLIKLHTGEQGLANVEELLRKVDFTEIRVGNLGFVIPNSKEYQDRLQKVLEVMKTLNTMFDPYIPPAQPYQEASVLLMPGREYVRRAFATGSSIVMNFESDRLGTFAHEYTHLRLMQSIGISKTTMLVEGAAMYFGKKVVPSGSSNDPEGCDGVDNIHQMMSNDLHIGLSHTELVQDAGIQVQAHQEYEYAYGIGSYLVGYLVEKFGTDTFLDVYKETCKDNMFDVKTGDILIRNGKGVGRQRDILANALAIVSAQKNMPQLKPEIVKDDFQHYLRFTNGRRSVARPIVDFLMGGNG